MNITKFKDTDETVQFIVTYDNEEERRYLEHLAGWSADWSNEMVFDSKERHFVIETFYNAYIEETFKTEALERKIQNIRDITSE